MINFVTSDCHWGHENIIKYCGRPFKNGEHMHKTLIRNWNERVKPEDTVYHLGDWCFKGGQEGSKTKAQIWEDKLNGKVIHVIGNHDLNNSVKGILTHAVFEFGGKVILAQHIPPTMALEVPEYVDFVLAGHVHEMYKYKMLEDYRNERIPIPIINVGVDQWNFRPVKMQEIIKFYDKIMKEK